MPPPSMVASTSYCSSVVVMRRGSVTIMRWLADGKYSSIGRLFTVSTPPPVRTRTRATACLRRPVVWMSGLGNSNSSLRRALGDGGQVERLGTLGGVGMRGPRVDLQLLEHVATERRLRDHPADGLA